MNNVAQVRPARPGPGERSSRMDTPATSRTAAYQFSLVKGAQFYLVRCVPGKELETIAQLMKWANDPALDFDRFDVAVLSRQIAQRALSREIGEPAQPPSEP
jgi:hypothetical protein